MKQRFSKRTRLVSALLTLAMVFTFFSVSALCGTLDRRAIEREGESSLYQNNVTLSLGYMFR